MVKTKSSQVSVEFVIILSILLILLLIVISIISSRNSIIKSKEREYYAKQVVIKLSSEINSAYLAGDGYNKTIELPSSLRDGTAYKISVYPQPHIVDIVYTFIDDRHFSMPIIAGDITGNLINLSGNVRISNSNSQLTLN